MKDLLILPTSMALAGIAAAQERAELNPNDPGSRAAFAQCVALSGNSALLGSPTDHVTVQGQGSAYVFVASGSIWSQQAKLVPGDARAQDHCGTSAGISGDSVVLGASQDDHVDGSNADEGSAYVFVRSGTVWSEQSKITASDAGAGDLFGFAVAIDTDTIAVGAPYDNDLGADSGSVYVFTRTGATWTQQAKLTAGDGAAGDLLGASITLDGDTLVAGAPRHDDTASNSGSCYVFVRAGTVWNQQAKLNAADPTAGDSFGRALSLFGDRLVAGAFQKDDNGIDSGCAYVFTRAATVWSQPVKLEAGDASTFDNFGKSVSISGDLILVGACQDNVVGRASGSAYVFQESGATWSEISKLTPLERAEGDFFGGSVSLSGPVAVVGAAFDDDSFLNSGSAHVFSVGPEGTPFCFPGADAMACPCSNPPAGSSGCDNFGSQSGGASLSGTGLASLTADSLSLNAAGENNTSLTIFWQGKTDITPGVAHGAGVRCVSGTLKRLYSGSAAGGTIARPIGADPNVHTRSASAGDTILAGQFRYYFTIYRDPQAATPCGNTSSTINLSNAVEVLWAP